MVILPPLRTQKTPTKSLPIGVKDFDVSLSSQIVKVNTKEDSDLTYEKVLNTIGKTGKKINEGAEYVGGEKVSRPVALATA